MHSFSLLWMYVARDIGRSKALFALIVFSLAVASTALLLTIGILDGFRVMLTDGERGWLGDIVITPQDDDRSIEQVRFIEEQLRSLPEVEAFSLRSRSQSVLRYENKKTTPFQILGIDPSSDGRVTWLQSKMIEGTYFENSTADEVILGKNLSDSLIGSLDDDKSVHPGEDIYVLSSSGEYKPYRVRGVVDAKTFFPNWSLFFTKDRLEKIDASSRNSQLIVKISDEKQVLGVRDSLRAQFPGATVKTWEEESSYTRDILQTVTFVTRSIHDLLVLTVFMVISIVIFINVNQKRKQIGILKAMGTNNSFIVTAYITQASIYAVFGFIIGLGLFSIFFWWSVDHPTSLLIGDFRLQASLMTGLSSFITLAIAAIGGALIPSFMAARMRIIDVIRNNN